MRPDLKGSAQWSSLFTGYAFLYWLAHGDSG